MIELTNYVSKILHNDTDHSNYIVTYIDLDKAVTPEYVLNYINEITSHHKILTQLIVKYYGEERRADQHKQGPGEE